MQLQQKNREITRSSTIHIVVKAGVTILLAICSIAVALCLNMQDAQATSAISYQPKTYETAKTKAQSSEQPYLQSLDLDHEDGDFGPDKPHPPHIERPNRPDIDDFLDYNSFPFGTCTWYADNRFHELYGYFVPWHNNAMAWQWADRAAERGWDVSATPSVGSIIVLQSGVQGAGSAGHVGIVEQVLDDGSVVASSMNWWPNPAAVSYQHYQIGQGVSFAKPS